MTESESIRILVVDDHPVVREGLRAILDRQSDLTVVAEAASGEEALARFREHRPDVTLMDLRLHGIGGVEATARICAEFPGSRVLILTTYDGDEEIYQALRAGALGYVLKGVPREELLSAIRAVHRGSHRILARSGRSPGGARGRARSHSEGAGRHPARGRGPHQQGDRIGAGRHGGDGEGYLHQIFGKMGVADRTEAATQAIKRGIVHLE